MSGSTRPKLNRFKYAAILLGAGAVAAAQLASPAIASAQKYWDVVDYGTCIDEARAAYQRGTITLQDLTEADHICCVETDGVWNPDRGILSRTARRCPGLTAASGQRSHSIRYRHRTHSD